MGLVSRALGPAQAQDLENQPPSCIPGSVKSSSLHKHSQVPSGCPSPSLQKCPPRGAGQGGAAFAAGGPGVTLAVPSQHCHWGNFSCLQKTLFYPFHSLLCYSTTNPLYRQCLAVGALIPWHHLLAHTPQFPGAVTGSVSSGAQPFPC